MKKIEIKVDGPLGPSERGSGFGTDWNNTSTGTDGPVTCEICGTHHPLRKDESYTLSMFLGKQVVEECCGAILDVVYAESGEEFTEKFLKEFSENPTGCGFLTFRSVLFNCLSKAQEVISEVSREVDAAAKSAAVINQE